MSRLSIEPPFCYTIFPGGETHYHTPKRARDAAIEHLKAPCTHDTHVKICCEHQIAGRVWKETIGLVWVTTNERGVRTIHVRFEKSVEGDE